MRITALGAIAARPPADATSALANATDSCRPDTTGRVATVVSFTDAGLTGDAAAPAAAAGRGAPQSLQNRAVAGLGPPHFGQGLAGMVVS
jgi:hypothetical protein